MKKVVREARKAVHGPCNIPTGRRFANQADILLSAGNHADPFPERLSLCGRAGTIKIVKQVQISMVRMGYLRIKMNDYQLKKHLKATNAH